MCSYLIGTYEHVTYTSRRGGGGGVFGWVGYG